MSCHALSSQRNRGTLPGRARWRMAPWEALSINSPRKMPGQGNSSYRLHRSTQTFHKTSQRTSREVRFSIPLLHQAQCQCAAECVICRRSAGDAVRLSKHTTKHTTKLFREKVFFWVRVRGFVMSVIGDKRTRVPSIKPVQPTVSTNGSSV